MKLNPTLTLAACLLGAACGSGEDRRVDEHDGGLLANGGFDQDEPPTWEEDDGASLKAYEPKSWTREGKIIVIDVPKGIDPPPPDSAPNTVKLWAEEPGPGIYQEVEAVGGVEYLATVVAMAEPTNSVTSPVRGDLELAFIGADGEMIGTEIKSAAAVDRTEPFEWTVLEAQGVAPESAAKVRVTLRHNGTSGGEGAFFFDSATLSEI